MGQAVSRRSLAAEAGFNSRPGHVRFVVYNMATRQNFLKYVGFAVSIIPPCSILTHSFIHHERYTNIVTDRIVK